MTAVAARHVIAGLLVLDPHVAGRAWLDTAVCCVLWQPGWLGSDACRAHTLMVIVLEVVLATDTSLSVATASRHSVPCVAIVEVFRGLN